MTARTQRQLELIVARDRLIAKARAMGAPEPIPLPPHLPPAPVPMPPVDMRTTAQVMEAAEAMRVWAIRRWPCTDAEIGQRQVAAKRAAYSSGEKVA